MGEEWRQGVARSPPQCGSLFLIFGFLHYILKLAEKGRDIRQYCLPDDFVINIEIAVNKTMAHSDDGMPGYVRIKLTRGGAHLARGFTDDFERFDNGKKQLPVIIQIGPLSADRKAHSVGVSVEHVSDVDQVMRMHTQPSLPLGRRRGKGDSNRLGCAGPRGGLKGR